MKRATKEKGRNGVIMGILTMILMSVVLLTAALTEAAGKPAWEAEWERTLKEARKEGKVVLYSSYPSKARVAIAQAFKDKYGIDAEFVTGRGSELRAKIEKERTAGIYVADFFLKGVAGQDFELIKNGTLDPLKPLLIRPDVLDAKMWFGERMPWIDDAGQYFFGFIAAPSGEIQINTSMVNADEIKSWYDFLEPRWKGKIILADPTTSGSANMMFSVMGNHTFNFDYWRKLARQEPVISRNQRLMAEWLARGKYPVLIGVAPYAVAEFVLAGAPIKFKILKEGGWVAQRSGVIAHINRAPHPAAAKIFANWILSKEGGTIVAKANRYQSARVDVPTDHLTSGELRQPGVKYFDARTEKTQIEQIEAIKLAKEIFGPLLK